jgi:hypothetical protein
MRLLSCFAVIALLFGGISPSHAQCLEAERDEFVQGDLMLGDFKDAAGRDEPAFILILPEPVCLGGEDEFDNVEDADAIQIYSSDEQVDGSIADYVGETVLVRGQAFGAMTVHHHAPIVMDISSIEHATEWAAPRIVKPPRGSALRAQLLDAARPVFRRETGGPVEFVVVRLNVMGDWAFGEVRLQRPSGQPIDWSATRYADDFEAGMFDPAASDFLLRRTSDGWKVVEFATGPTDVVWDGWRHDYGLPLALFEW